ncbi:hypothetical protein HKD42_07825 [Altererythrobacter sp. RZ02]|uniref:Uncharacterized protein n=1 Tax=Pontixanthobacter rizhaonensis TaxID=2730337 RepID=A0A848QPA6_9SPHN|nr:hypothetical protein [Pontixanthobacter rizhaonensis]NMW31965.1 hypothetical protein [Pontixanthobacter rizhaonensis]
MMELVEANWPVAIIAVVVVILAAWWLFVALRRTKVTTDTSDVLDEGHGPAARNNALIDAPPAAVQPDSVPLETAAEKKPVQAASGSGDDLSRIKGVGPKLVAILHENGVTGFSQIAAWSEADIDAIDAKLGRFQGRIRRDNWPEQARFLAADDTAGYEGKFGKL